MCIFTETQRFFTPEIRFTGYIERRSWRFHMTLEDGKSTQNYFIAGMNGISFYNLGSPFEGNTLRIMKNTLAVLTPSNLSPVVNECAGSHNASCYL